MAKATDYKVLNKFLDAIAEHCRDQLDIVEPTEQFPAFLHISRDKSIKEFVPAVSQRTTKSEDRTIPRVCTAPHLFGCFVGYSSAFADYFHRISDLWKGGYYIYALPAVLALEPSKKLLPDVKSTDERWLVGYDDAHRAIKPTIVGKCFIHSLQMVGMDESRRTDFTIYLEFTGGTLDNSVVLDELAFSRTQQLKPGYYKIQVCNNADTVYWNSEHISITQIPKADYQKAKTITAGLLSFEGGPSATW